MIKTYPEDIEFAFDLLKTSLFRRADELSTNARGFYNWLCTYLKKAETTQFTALDIRKEKRIHPRTLNRYLQELTLFQYIQVAGGNKYREGYQYKITAMGESNTLNNSIEKALQKTLETIKREHNTQPKEPAEELDTLFDNYYQIFVRGYDDRHHRHDGQRRYSLLYRERNILIVSILFNQGVITSEVERIELNDIDLIKATIKIRGAARGNDRTLPLKATQIGLFINYMQNIRPKLLEYQTQESEKLFLPLPAVNYKTAKNEMTRNIFTPLAAQMKSIDKQFIDFT